MRDEERSAVLYMVAALPMLFIALIISYLRVRKKALKAERAFYRSLILNGMDKHMARELASEYSAPTSISFWMREFMGRGAPFTGRHGRKD